ncbi:ABC transporter ATP-binding protein/permease [bacterium]|nr:ABC transporter ATP-binding protein/permease [bacterium]
MKTKEWIEITIWVIKTVFSINPLYATGYLVVSVISGLRAILDTYVLAKVIDTLINIAQKGSASIEALYPLLVLLIVVEGVMLVISLFNSYFRRMFRITISPYLNQRLYTKINSLDIQTLEDPDTNNRLTRARENIHNITGYFRRAMSLVGNISAVISAMGIILSFMPWVIPLILLGILPGMFTDKKFRKLSWKLNIDTTENSRITSGTTRQLGSYVFLPEIFVNRSFKFFDKKIMKFREWFMEKKKVLAKKWLLSIYAWDVIGLVPIYLGLYAILKNMIVTKISTGTVYFQLEMLRMLKAKTENMFYYYNDMFEYALKLKDVYELFQTERTFPDGIVKMEKLETGPRISVENVSFRYPHTKRFVIKDLDLRIEPGEKVAIVGHNGAGKTTLVKLICRLYKVTKGEIKINDVNVNDLVSDTLFQNVGLLYQEYNTHGQLTARENIIIGNPDKKVDMKKVKAAAKSADALEFIEKLPKKWDQILSQSYEDGIRPSTGQWQKIAIARFFYRNAPLVIFDEPTAAIDAISEYNIFNKIYEFFQNKTVIIISHRFSTVRNADRIIVVEEGQIIEDGTHKELMDKDGYYAKSFELQAAGYNK